jgi:hypothetical protein
MVDWFDEVRPGDWITPSSEIFAMILIFLMGSFSRIYCLMSRGRTSGASHHNRPHSFRSMPAPSKRLRRSNSRPSRGDSSFTFMPDFLHLPVWRKQSIGTHFRARDRLVEDRFLRNCFHMSRGRCEAVCQGAPRPDRRASSTAPTDGLPRRGNRQVTPHIEISSRAWRGALISTI